jgi:MFS family permease
MSHPKYGAATRANVTVAQGLLANPNLTSGIRKATYRLMPMLIILYFIAFLDRTNVGFAEAAMEVDRGITAGAYALGAGIFFIGYALFEIPSNLLLNKFGARFWLARIAVTWGIVAAAFAFVNGETMFIILRFLLGVTEAGLFPGVIMFLAQWFPNKRRVQMFALFYLAQPFSQMLGAPLSGGLVSFGDKVTPWAGWQVGLVSAIPWAVGLFACYYVGKHATTVRRRRVWGALFFIVTGVAILVSAWAGANAQGVLGILAITVAVAAFLSVGPITWSFPTSFLTGAAAATGIGLINSLGNLGGIVAPIMRTGINEAAPTDSGEWGVVSLGVFAFLAAAMRWGTRFFSSKADALLVDEEVLAH